MYGSTQRRGRATTVITGSANGQVGSIDVVTTSGTAALDASLLEDMA